jgi:hypothetical protein
MIVRTKKVSFCFNPILEREKKGDVESFADTLMIIIDVDVEHNMEFYRVYSGCYDQSI